MGETGFYLNFLLAYSTNPKHEAHLYASEAKLVRSLESRAQHMFALLFYLRLRPVVVRAFVVDIFKLSEDKVPFEEFTKRASVCYDLKVFWPEKVYRAFDAELH